MFTRTAALVGLIVAGCTADEGATGLPDAGTAEPLLTQSQARFAGRALAAAIEDAATRFGPVTPGATANAACISISGDDSDADGDSIPVSAKLTFDCSKRRLGFTGTLTGLESISDTQPDAAAWAFAADLDLSASLAGPLGGSMVVSTTGSTVASQGSIVGPYTLTSTLDLLTDITTARGRQVEITENLDWKVRYTPDVDWSAGSPAVVGKLDVDGVWAVDIDGASGVASLETVEPLTFRPTCESRITAGTVVATFETRGQSAALTVQWTGCGQPEVSYQ